MIQTTSHAEQPRHRSGLFHSMLLAAAASLLMAASANSAAPANKCVIDGTVTYQQGPCPSGQARKLPTTQELNAEEKQRRAAAASAPAKSTRAALPAPTTPTPSPSALPPGARPEAPAMPSAKTFKCDGRQYCSQMSSCAEAKYFLAHCPGVKMDGNRDGIPCEQQWCR